MRSKKLKYVSILIEDWKEEKNVLPNYLPRYSLKEYNIAEIKSPSPVHETPRNNGTCLKDILEGVFGVKTVDKSGQIFLKWFQSSLLMFY